MSGARKSLGFDPGSSSWKIAVVDDRQVVSTEKVDTARISAEPDLIRGIVEAHIDGLEAIAAPSGFGLPLTTIDRIDQNDVFLMTLKREEPSMIGLGKAVFVLKDIHDRTGVPCFVLPSVKHLGTVPRWRKINRIDLGTSDKLCAAAHALQRLSERHSTTYGGISFILSEVGHRFTSMICVKEGRIVDGIGGTCAGFGTMATGALDAELAYLWSFPDKSSIYSGGLVHVSRIPADGIAENLRRGSNPQLDAAISRYAESFASDAIAIASRNEVDNVVLSSALDPVLTKILEGAARDIGLKVLTGINDGFSSSIGAAYLANGLVGGRYRDLVQCLDLRNSCGSVMDDIYLRGIASFP